MRGWVKIHRDLSTHPVWLQEKFTRGQAWVDLILLAKFEPGYVRKRGARITLFRGQLAWSQAELAIRWDWSRNKLRRFLKELEEDGMITVKRTNVSSTITIVNYEKWQGKEEQTEQTNEPPYRPYISRRENSFESNSDEPPNETAKGQQTDTKRTPFKNGKNTDKVNKKRRELLFNTFSTSLESLKEEFREVDVDLSYNKYQNHCNSKGRSVNLEGFQLWLERDRLKGWNIKKTEPKKTVTVYCPYGHGAKEVTGEDRNKSFCAQCEAQMQDKEVLAIEHPSSLKQYGITTNQRGR
jgi:hypothetical protein